MHAIKVLALSCLAVWVACSAGAQGFPAAADHTPADAEVVVLVPSLRALSSRAASLENAAGLEAGDLQDVLGIFKREFGLISGLDDNGSMMLAMTGVGAALEAGQSPNTYLVLPVADYDALLRSLNAEPGLESEITLPSGFTGVMKQAGQHAIIAADAQALDAYRPGGQGAPLLADVGGVGVQLANTSSLTVIMDTDATRAKIAEALTDLKAVALTEINTLLAFDLDPEGWRPLMSALNQTIAQGTDTAVLALTIDERGLTYREAYAPKPDTDLNAILPGDPTGQGTDQILASLVDRPVVAAFAAETHAVDIAQLTDQVAGVIGLQPVSALGELREPLAEALQGVDTVAAAYYTLPQHPEQLIAKWLNAAVVLQGEDPAAIAGQVRTFITKLNGAQIPLPTGEPIRFVALYQPKARTVAGQTIDTFTVRMSIPESAQTTPMTQALAALAGVGFTGQLVATDTHVLITTTDDDTATTAILAGLNQPNGLGSTGVIDKVRKAQLPGRNAMQAYLDLGGVAQSLNPVLQMIGGGQAITTDKTLEPIALSIEVLDGQAIVTAHIPTGVLNLLHDQDFSLSDQADPPR